MKNLLVLFVDNDDSMFDSCRETAIEWNEAEENDLFNLEIIRAENIEEANQFLDRYKFHAAITDLRLPIKNEEESPVNGNNLALTAMHERGLPIAIVSGYIKDLEKELTELRHVGSFTKDDGYRPAFDWLATNFEMIQTLSKAKSNIEKISSEVFAKRIWPQWQQWKETAESDGHPNLADTVTRQYACQIAGFLGSESVAASGWHPFETYIIPGIYEDRSHTGDLFQFDDGIWIVLSPQCDMATQKIGNVLLAKCEKDVLTSGWEKYRTKNDAKGMAKLTNQNVEKRLHFLPPLPGETVPIFVTFNQVKTMPLKELNGAIPKNRIASVSSEFLGNITQRFGSFISRTGQPNLSMNHYFIEK